MRIPNALRGSISLVGTYTLLAMYTYSYTHQFVHSIQGESALECRTPFRNKRASEVNLG